MKTSIISKVFAAMIFAAMSVPAMAQQIVKNGTQDDGKTSLSGNNKVYTIRFDLYNHKGVFLMPYEGQIVGDKFTKNFNYEPDTTVVSKEEFDCTTYYSFYEHDGIIYFTDDGLKVPGCHPDYKYPMINIGQMVAVYVIENMPTNTDYESILKNAWYVHHPFELKKMNITVYEDNWGSFEHYYTDPNK